MNRYIGEDYSKAQEKLEDDMKEFYRQDNSRKPLISLSSGQLTAVITDEEEEILRAQVCEVKSDKVKVRSVVYKAFRATQRDQTKIRLYQIYCVITTFFQDY